MKIRGERECTECGTRWSYYETGSVGCPACGSLRSVGLDDRTEHTDTPVKFDLTPVRNAVDETGTVELAERARDRCREYVRTRGFVNGGRLRDLDETYLAATELLHAADIVSRRHRLETTEELYFLSLLASADEGERPPAEELPESIRDARGLAAADAVRAYRRDARTWLGDRTLPDAERSAFDELGEHVTRVRLLEGDVSPETAETLVAATREVADALRGTESALARAEINFERLR